MGLKMEIKIKTLTLIALIGALVALIGVFLPWISDSIMGIIPISMSGWDMITMDGASGTEHTCMIIAFVMIIVALLLAILDIVDVKLADAKIMQIITLIVGVLIVVLIIIAVKDGFDQLTYGGYMSIIGGALVAVAGVLGIAGVVKE